VSFIDKYSWRSFLGPRAKEIVCKNTYAYWKTFKATNVVFFKGFDSFDKLEPLVPFTTYYMDKNLVDDLKKTYKVSCKKTSSTIVDISKLNIAGKRMKDIRWAINNINKKNLTIETNYRKIDDVKLMIKTWKEFSADKYFQDRSSKNILFYDRGYHEGCINIFCYDADKLVSFGSLSPAEDGSSSYVLGKSLYKDYSGLSEYTDVMLFKMGLNFGIRDIDLGDGGKELMNYKNKFSSSRKELFYHGKISKR